MMGFINVANSACSHSAFLAIFTRKRRRTHERHATPYKVPFYGCGREIVVSAWIWKTRIRRCGNVAEGWPRAMGPSEEGCQCWPFASKRTWTIGIDRGKGAIWYRLETTCRYWKSMDTSLKMTGHRCQRSLLWEIRTVPAIKLIDYKKNRL